MKITIALILLIAPWVIFVYAARVSGGTSTFVLVLTLMVSAVGFTMLIGGSGKRGPRTIGRGDKDRTENDISADRKQDPSK